MPDSVSSQKKYKRNNLDRSSSPYLIQHRGNPVWWQEWSEDVIKYAFTSGNPLLVSVGYSTCHWCHVMAMEAFSDERTAKFLNDNFVCIKIDREQRPDIDQFMMEFIQKQTGRGGWPLNVFLTPALDPIFALTYAPTHQKGSMNSFLSIVQQIHTYFQKNSNDIPSFVHVAEIPDEAEEKSLIKAITRYSDHENGGFGNSQKFPSHSTLLFLLYKLSIDNDHTVREMCVKAFDAMRLRGLNDHLQGGIFRYCVDESWTIPHFEKMLYDQAMSLWTYSLAYRILGDPAYKTMAENIVRCLDDSFENDGFYITAHDADTGHEEGKTYLWSYNELKEALTDEEFKTFSSVYNITPEGNFEERNHLIRMNDRPVMEIEEKLLALRKTREQPSIDDKILCGNNALVAIALIQASRLIGRPDLEVRAGVLAGRLIEKFWDGKTLAHSWCKGILQRQGFLSDAAALFTVITMLYEDDPVWKPQMEIFEIYLLSFREGETWIESKADDFMTIYASSFDHPVPSGIGLAELGLVRFALLTEKDIPGREYRRAYQSDFYNITAMISNGLFHVVTSKNAIDWDILPANSIQLRGEHEQDCYLGTCRIIENDYFF